MDLRNCDNMELMAQFEDKYFDFAVVDPPYGLDKKLSSGGGKMRNSPFKKLYRDSSQWDIVPTPEYWKELFRVSKNQIVFGANYFLEHLPSSRGFICWDKRQAMPTLSACELVWTSIDKPSKVYRKVSTDLDRFHPTQKPVELYKFCLDYVKAEKGMKILDTHLGSGSIAIACHYAGLELTASEIDKGYFEKALKRIKDKTCQVELSFNHSII